VSDLLPTLRAVAWGLGLWLVVSLAAAVVVSGWFRRRARANDMLEADARRQEFIEAATSERTIRS